MEAWILLLAIICVAAPAAMVLVNMRSLVTRDKASVSSQLTQLYLPTMCWDKEASVGSKGEKLAAHCVCVKETLARVRYEIREAWDGQWGTDPGDGNWTGIVGILQRQQADFGYDLDLTPARLKVLDFSTLYVQERIAIFSLKPGLLPQHLAFIRPFIGVVWLILFVSYITYSITLWFMQKAWSLTCGGRSMDLSYAFLYGWSVLMEEFSSNPSITRTSRVLVGLWMLVCVILTNAYRSSLVANLIIQEKMPAINSFQDLLARDGWAWGTSFANDSTMDFYRYNPSADIKKIYKGMQYAPAEEQFRRVLKGSYSHITYKNYGMGIVAAALTNSRGYTPIHISRAEYLLYFGVGWGFRRGAPFLPRISKMIQHLIEGGFIDHWLDDVISSHMRKTREETEDGEENVKIEEEIFEVVEGRVSLGFTHLQGAFYILIVGCGLSFLTWLGENFARYCS